MLTYTDSKTERTSAVPKKRRFVFDLETDGLLPELTRIHIMVVADADTGQRWIFRHNSEENTIPEGIALLNEADVLISHNGVGFDEPALAKVYPDIWNPTGISRDTLVMVRMLFSNEKENDFRRWHRGLMDGKLIGSNELKAWGQRLGLDKGDYADNKLAELKNQFPDLDKKSLMKLVWAEWSQEMEDYAIRDVDITVALWRKIENKPWSQEATLLEHQVHDLMERVSRNGFPLNLPEAYRLEKQMRDKCADLEKIAEDHFGIWWAPDKWIGDETKAYCDPLTGNVEKNSPRFKPRVPYGEDASREWWGEVKVSKRSTKFKDVLRGDTEAGTAFCPVKVIKFNPGSRLQIINRLQKVYQWVPQEFTEKNTPIVNDEVLRDLANTVPICDELAEIFYYNKRLGQLIDGKNGLIGKAEEYGDGKVHPRINVGGTVTNRAAHSNPNIAQVPRVVFKQLKQWIEQGVAYDFSHGGIIYGIKDEYGNFVPSINLTPKLDPDGKQFIGRPVMENGEYVLDPKTGKIKTKKDLLKGRAGDHGWDFRNLFYVPDTHVLMGADQKGIELRCLAHFMAEFDGGEYMKLVCDPQGDIHDLHQSAMELDSRDTAKTFVYAMVYGAADYKLGITIDPTLVLLPAKAKALGAEMRRRLMTRIPALGAVIKAVQEEAKKSYVTGLDGRQLYVRGPHSALNTKLQGAAATIAKKWCVTFELLCEDAGLVHSWEGDYAILAWIHDETQTAVRNNPATMEIVRKACYEASRIAGETFNFRGKVEIDTKFGNTWANTH